MADKKLALVQWCGGIDDKTYTSGIPIQWIRNFDYQVYRSDKSASTKEAYAVEWRDSKKPPKGGWKLYDAYVILISGRLNVLDDKMKMLEGLVSPYKQIPQNLQDSSESNGKDKVKGNRHHSKKKQLSLNQLKLSTPGTSAKKEGRAPESTTGAKKRRVIVSSDEESVTQEEVSGIDVLPKSPGVKKSNTSSQGERTDSSGKDADSDEEQHQLSPLHDNQNSDGEEEQRRDSPPEVASGEDEEFHAEKNRPEAEKVVATTKTVRLEDIMEAITSMNRKLTRIEVLLTTGAAKTVVVAEGAKKHSLSSERETSGPASKNARFLEDGEFTEGNIEIGEVGSKVFVTDMQWAKATSTPTYTAMTVSLLLASIPLDTLLRSNYKGGASKVNKGDAEAGPARQALDERIIEAIKYSVRHQHPKEFKEGGFGQAINVKLSALRRLQKKER